MPAKHTIKIYVQDGIYHIYNRGVEKRTIFEEEYDYRVFSNCLKESLLPRSLQGDSLQGVTFVGERRPVKNFYGVVELLAYCLMPNHFHLLVKQHDAHTIDGFMRSLATRYSIYFNKKYKRVGPLFQGAYKAVFVDSDMYLLHLSRYIHRNPSGLTKNLSEWYSSYAEYLKKRHTDWVDTQIVLASFQPGNLPFLRHTNSYQGFVEYDSTDYDVLTQDLTLEEEF